MDQTADSGAAIHLRSVFHSYGGGIGAVPVLRGVDLDIAAGDYTALSGRSGAGKTTLLSLVGGLERPTAGEVEVGSRSVGSLRGSVLADFRRDTVGFVFQHFGLLDALTAVENVELSMTLTGAERGMRRRRATDLLGAVGLGDRLEHRPRTLSGGERQRVAIARAVANRPRLILADEPTGNLDDKAGALVLDLLERLRDERGCTLLVVTHNRAVAARAAQRYRLKDGRVVPR
jgi:putative ABC transport system ATP-binding protein